MGSQVGTDEDCYLACVYCSTYRGVEDFLKSDTKWSDMLQLGGQCTLFLLEKTTLDFVCPFAQTAALWLAFSCVQAEARVKHGWLNVAFGKGDGVSEGTHECKHQSDTDLVERCHHQFRCACHLFWYLWFCE